MPVDGHDVVEQLPVQAASIEVISQVIAVVDA